MKKFMIAISVLVLIATAFAGCKKTNAIPLQAADIPVPTNTPTPADTPVPFVPQVGPLLDDMNDNDHRNMWGGYWYSYDDLGTPNNGDSYVVPWTDARWTAAGGAGTFFMQAPGSDGTGYAARMTGYVTNLFTYGFIGMGTAFVDPKAAFDLSSCTEISFWEKGDGKSYRMKISSNSALYLNGTGDNFYGYQFVSHTDWYQHTVLVSNLTKDGTWGSVVPISTAMATATDFQFQTVLQPHASIDLWIDNITINGCTFP